VRGAALIGMIAVIAGCRGTGDSTAPEAGWCAAEVLRSAEVDEVGGDGRLHALNRQFLAAHARARAAECERLAKERLVLRFAGGVLEARWKGRAIGGGRVDVLPPEFHPVKDVSHAVFLAALLFAERAGGEAVTEAIAGVDAATEAIGAARVPAELVPGLRRILGRTREALTVYAAGRLDVDAQAAYFAAVRPDVQANLRAVAGAVVRGLHAAVSRVRAEVAAADPGAWANVVVVVGGVSHQARARDIGVQYFERLLAEPVAEGAQGERRLIVAEGVMDAAGQVGLAAAHAVDRVGGAVIFGEPARLQRDALADDGGALDAVLPVPQDR
jgi:hypothetical protein